MKIAKHGAGIAARSNLRTHWASATLLGLAWAGSAHALTSLGPAMLNPTACFHKDQGFIARAQLDFSPESADALFDVYKGAYYQGQWAFQNSQGQWVVLPPSIGVVPIAGNAIRHPQRTLGAGVNTLDVGIAEPALRTPGMLPGLTVFVGYGVSGPQSFADLLARQRFGVVAQLVGNEPLRDNCDTPSPAPAPGAGGGGGGAAPTPAPAPATPGTPAPSPTPSPAPAGSPVALNIRVQGLGLGRTLQLGHGTATLSATLNEPYRFAPQVAAGTALDLRVTTQPTGQSCAVSGAAPATVPADGAPVFVRCVHTAAAHVMMPDTAPRKPLAVGFALRDLAYPGIAYESRPGVVGGIFPYEYRLQGFTRNGVEQNSADLSLDFRRGTVRFTPAAEGSYTVTLEIRDSGSAQQTLVRSFTIDAAASRFVFVAPDGQDGSGRGARALPYRTVAYAMARTTSSQAIVLRKGSYLTGALQILDSKAKQILAYPDEVATLDMNKVGNISVASSTAPAPRIEGVDITNVKQYGIVSDPSKAGLVVRNVRFVNGEEGPTLSENPAFIHGWGDNAPAWRHQFLVQDNDFGTYVGAGYATTFFDAGESLMENNQLRLGKVNGGFHDKDNSQNNTYRENYIEFSATNSTTSGIQVSAQANSVGVHIHHNLLVNAGISLGVQCFQQTCFMRDHDVHHNTLVNQRIAMNWGPFNPTSAGTRISHNILSSRSTTPYGGLSCQSRPAGLATQLSARANLIESTGTLAFKDSECTGNDMAWPVWQGTYGQDMAASGSTVGAASVLTGSGPTTGLPAGDARRTQRGHQY
ncbi:right-handed parallel beta-helix repeat-containing protein [Acidovorax sp. A1169]|uniref:right-handed parallel beta-helix repeat-containing protein n=1 Tax=Acidovorax sp. A1169 TaxID=3059524 RepID=UPI002737A5D9|nr:right-handed parallel beta-helix repeat-containing protein [Acidovorax sp. A1169]MDP4075466.1 right-handed parallel beta-helix repeat-containing protein [Acidovorax sp. A1169]